MPSAWWKKSHRTAKLLTTFSRHFLSLAFIFILYALAQESRDIRIRRRRRDDSGRRHVFKLECLFLNYDGVKFGEAGVFLHVTEFRGLNPIVALSNSTIRVRTTSERPCRERSEISGFGGFLCLAL
ncbi:hypothetical protein N7467_002318 [Penicillium canescens]|nr:hypothetical protein N7467_002318 [Penicillium canescens]